MQKFEFNQDLSSKLFLKSQSKKFEIYFAHTDISEEKKKQLVRELDYFADRVEKILKD